jgi:hypothetical protein
MYTLIKPTTPFVLVADPGDFPMYNNFATKAAIKMTDKQFEHNKNYYLSFVNINRACFSMLNDNIADQLKVSNTPNMMGWKSSMSICSIIKQLENSYGEHNTMLLFHNNALFHSPFPATKPLKCSSTESSSVWKLRQLLKNHTCHSKSLAMPPIFKCNQEFSH